MDGVLKVRGGGDLRPVLVTVLLPSSCRLRSEVNACNDIFYCFHVPVPFSTTRTFLWREYGDDLVSGLPLLWYGRQRPRAVIARL